MPRKDRILLFIDEYMQAQGCAPTIREICANEEIKNDLFGLSSFAASRKKRPNLPSLSL